MSISDRTPEENLWNYWQGEAISVRATGDYKRERRALDMLHTMEDPYVDQ